MTEYNELKTVDVKSTFVITLLAGAIAGTSVDVILHPLDTLKTRLQSKQGFIKSGGFSNVYKGILPVVIGSAPGASLFFVTYEHMKCVIQCHVAEKYHPLIHMGSASSAEMVACLIRVPTEVIKQRKQVSILDRSDINLRMLYCGYWSTILRDVPFSLIQFPMWEYFKKLWSSYVNRDINPIESAISGSTAGGITATLTTPLDVIKTRIILSHRNECSSKLKILHVLNDVHKTQGLRGLFAGLGPRVISISIGGFIFFGSYETTKYLIKNYYSS